jgi:hypothetical protein
VTVGDALIYEVDKAEATDITVKKKKNHNNEESDQVEPFDRQVPASPMQTPSISAAYTRHILPAGLNREEQKILKRISKTAATCELDFVIHDNSEGLNEVTHVLTNEEKGNMDGLNTKGKYTVCIECKYHV